MSSKISKDEVFFCLSDLSNLILTFKRSILSFSIIFASCCFFYAMLSADIYQASAKFSEMPEKKEAHNLFQDIFSMGSSDSEKNKALEVMRSKTVIEPVVKKLGLQASIYPQSKNILLTILQRYFGNLKRELKFANKAKTYFSFRDVSYFSSASKRYFILFKKKDSFEVLDTVYKLKKRAKLNEKVSLDGVDFILQQIPSNIKINKIYVLNFAPIEACIDNVKKNLKIEVSKHISSVLNLTFQDRNPYLARDTLNYLMSSYVDYLKKESSLFAKEQFAYLAKRKKEVSHDLEKSLDNHAKYLSENLSKNGFMGLEQEVTSLTYPYSEHLKKKFALDLELSHIDILKKTDGDFIFNNELIGKKLALIANQKSLLNQKKDELSMSLLSSEKLLGNFSSAHLLNMSKLRKDKMEVNQALEHLKNNDLVNFSNLAFFTNTQVDELEQLSKEDLNCYLSQIKRALIAQEKTLAARPFYVSDKEEIFTGIDIDTAKELYISYNHKIDQSEAQVKQLKIVLQDIDKDNFEISTIIPFCSDTISQKLMSQSSEIEFKLNDNNNISEKDKNRLIDDLLLIRKFLKNHINQTLQAKEALLELYKKKLYALQLVTLDKTNQKISILDQQAKDYLFFRKENILKEKMLIQDQMKKIRNNMLVLPDKWKSEKLLQLRSEAALKIIQSLTNLIESKTIDYHLKQIVSKPMEIAELPINPQNKRGFLIFIVTFFVGNLLSFLYFFTRAIGREGFVATFDNLKAIDEIMLGKISYDCDGPKVEYVKDCDLETLRNIVQFSEPLLEKPGSLLSLVGGQGPNYAHALCNLISRVGKRALLIELNFQDQRSDEIVGLVQYLNKKIENIPIKKNNHYDFLSTGTTSRFGTEILRSFSFQQFIKEIKNKYDIVIAYGKVSPISAEAKTYLQFSDKVVISLIDEKVQSLSTFFQKGKMVGFLKVKS